ncbi:MAG: nitrophenyl compound nitroreductase subunit ArsF family protein [Alistipes sp.]
MRHRLLLLFVLFVSCTSNPTDQGQTAARTGRVDCVEVLYFHTAQRCATCRAIEKLTQEVLRADFATSLKKGQVVFRILDISTQEGEQVADHYQVAGSALLLDKNGSIENLTNTGFTYARRQPEVFKFQLREALKKQLK